MELISLVEYAEMNGIASATARQRAMRGSFKTAKKMGRDWVIDKDEPLVDNRKKGNDIMKELYQEELTKELIEKLNGSITFVEPVDLSKYDTITIQGDTIELYHEEYKKKPIIDKRGELMDYDYENKSYRRIFKRNNMTGVYIEC